jgi:hypothetical protein
LPDREVQFWRATQEAKAAGIPAGSGKVMQEHSRPSPNNPPEALGKFIREQNIAHFKKCLSETADETQRQVLLKLLASEMAKKQ